MDDERVRAARLKWHVRKRVAWFAVGVVVVCGVTLALLGLPGRVGSRAEGSPGLDAVRISVPARDARRVDVVGDSLIRQAESAVHQHLAASGADVELRSEPSRALDSSFVRRALAAVAADDRGRADQRRVLVVATAANDAIELSDRRARDGLDAARATYRDELTEVLAHFADRCVVVVDAKDDVAPIYHPDAARVVDDDLAAVVAAHPNARRAAWSDASRAAGSKWFWADQLHFGPDPSRDVGATPGATAYATAIAAAVASCP